MFLRGVADSAFGGRTESTVAVLLDDARVTYAAPDPDIRLVDVERVEILKGPKGSLYGTGALGGIYRVVTRRANLSRTEFAASVTGETVQRGSAGKRLAMANLPLARDKVALRLVGYGELAPGWVDTGARKDSNNSSLFGFRAGLGIDIGAGWRADATGFASGWTPTTVARSTLRWRAAARRNWRKCTTMTCCTVRCALRARRGRCASSCRAVIPPRRERALRRHAGASCSGWAIRSSCSTATSTKSGTTRSAPTGIWIAWLAGRNIYLSAAQKSSRNLSGLADTNLTVDNDNRSAEELALFGELSIPLTDRLEATAGARAFRSLIEESRIEGARAADFRFIRYGVTPAVGLSWKPEPGRLIYAHYGSAFRQGGTGVGDDGRIQALDGDELETLSAGWRDTIGAIRFVLGLYHSWWSSIQSDVLRPNGLIETANVGKGAISGAELSLEAEPAERWHLQAGAMLQSAKIDPLDASTDGDRRLPVVPNMTFRPRCFTISTSATGI